MVFFSDAYTTDEIIYIWDPVMPLDIIRTAVDCMPKFTIGNVSNETCNSQTATGASKPSTIYKLDVMFFSHRRIQLP